MVGNVKALITHKCKNRPAGGGLKGRRRTGRHVLKFTKFLRDGQPRKFRAKLWTNKILLMKSTLLLLDSAK